jgi:hypothetical protein
MRLGSADSITHPGQGWLATEVDLPPGLSFQDISTGARFLRGLPGFLRHPVRPEQARAVLQVRLAQRETDFLALVGRAIYRNTASPYRKLLQVAGCEYGDLEKLVVQQGLESALSTLLRHGVYLTLDEFKGRRPLVRGSVTLTVDPGLFGNPGAAVHFLGRTSGSRGPRSTVPLNLPFTSDRAVNNCLYFSARGGSGWLQAHWEVPGGSAVSRLLWLSHIGAPPVRWFSQVDPATLGLEPGYQWSARLVRWVGLLVGVRLPRPEYAPLDAPLPIVHWMADVLHRGRVPHLWTYASSAAQLCQAASEAGVDLSGAQLMVLGEPITAARLAVIRRAGAEALPAYGISECGPLGFGCLAPEAPDDLHVFHDFNAVIRTPADVRLGDLPACTLLVSSLRATAPFILLNVSFGDQAELPQRSCGCPLEKLGWTMHVHTIRSHEKLTAGGMTFLDTDVIRVLEEVLPARFGGGPTDYQLLERENEDGRAGVSLLVHPAVGPVDAAAVADTFLAALSPGAQAERVMALQWRQAGLLKVERRAPLAAPSGKILHLHTAPLGRPAGAGV